MTAARRARTVARYGRLVVRDRRHAPVGPEQQCGGNDRRLQGAGASKPVGPRHCQIERVNYYTAHISGRIDPDAPRRQHAYLRAIATLPKVMIHYGNFLVNQKWAGLVQPLDFRPPVIITMWPLPCTPWSAGGIAVTLTPACEPNQSMSRWESL